MKITIEELKKMGFVEKNQWLYLDRKTAHSEGVGFYFIDGLISLEGDYNTGIDLPHIDTVDKFKELYRVLNGRDINSNTD